jgi:hypothetical protein
MFTSTRTALPISNTALAARMSIFIAKGFLSSPDFPEASQAAKEQFGYGEDSLLECLLHPATLLAEQYDTHDDHPGVFEYEVAEPLGKWIAAYLALPETDGSIEWAVLIEKIQILTDRFFNFRNTMTPSEDAAIESLRKAGFAVVVWSPRELRGVSPKSLESRVVQHGNEVIEDLCR